MGLPWALERGIRRADRVRRAADARIATGILRERRELTEQRAFDHLRVLRVVSTEVVCDGPSEQRARNVEAATA